MGEAVNWAWLIVVALWLVSLWLIVSSIVVV